MRGSLQDQLLQSGIATEDQLKKNKPKPKPNGRSGANQRKVKTKVRNGAAKNYTATAKTAARGQKKAVEATPTLGKALRVEIKQLLKTNKLNDKEGEIPYNYVIAGQVKRFYINEKQQTELKSGNMVIVNWNTISYLISTEAEQSLRKLHPTIEVASVDNTPAPEKTDVKKETTDPYADYEIPDDLSW